MSNEQQFIITVRYPEWQQESFTEKGKFKKYPAFGVKYLLTTPIIVEPDWPEDDARWISWNPEKVVEQEFIKWYKAKIKGSFNGEILFIEPARLVVADGTKL